MKDKLLKWLRQMYGDEFVHVKDNAHIEVVNEDTNEAYEIRIRAIEIVEDNPMKNMACFDAKRGSDAVVTRTAEGLPIIRPNKNISFSEVIDES